MLFGRGSLGGSDESGTNPNGLGTVHEHSGQTSAVVNAASGDDVYLVDSSEKPPRMSMKKTHGLAGQGRFLVFADIDTGRNQDRRRGRSGVSTAFASLSTDDVNALVQCFLNMFRVSDHLRIECQRGAGCLQQVSMSAQGEDSRS